MNRTVKYQGAFSRIVGFAGKRFLFSPPPPPSIFFAPALTFALNSTGNACYAGYQGFSHPFFIFPGKSPGDEVGRFHEQFLSLSTSGFSWDVFASLAFKDFVRLLESKESQLAELSGQSALITLRGVNLKLFFWFGKFKIALHRGCEKEDQRKELTSRRKKVSKSLYFLPFSPIYTSSRQRCEKRIFSLYRRCNFVRLF